MSGASFIYDEFAANEVPPQAMDMLWAEGWRHFGERFFRYDIMLHSERLMSVVPLRIRLADFQMSKSQRRIWRKNADLSCQFVPASHSEETAAIFIRHRERFTENAPVSMLDFLSSQPATMPCRCLELRCHLADQLVAASFMDTGGSSASSVYGVFEPEHAERSLGIFTMLNELAWASQQGFHFLYPGYATREEGPYEYKKHFAGLQGYDWQTQSWKPWSDISTDS